MDKEKGLEIFELGYSKICCPCRLLALLAQNANANMRLQNHVHIIGAVSDGQCRFLRKSALDHIYYVSFLLWRDAASQYNVNQIRAFQKHFETALVAFDARKDGTRYYQGMLPCFILHHLVLLNLQTDLPQVILKAKGQELLRDDMLFHCLV